MENSVKTAMERARRGEPGAKAGLVEENERFLSNERQQMEMVVRSVNAAVVGNVFPRSECELTRQCAVSRILAQLIMLITRLLFNFSALTAHF